MAKITFIKTIMHMVFKDPPVIRTFPVQSIHHITVPVQSKKTCQVLAPGTDDVTPVQQIVRHKLPDLAKDHIGITVPPEIITIDVVVKYLPKRRSQIT
jgi:hypothetical protein